MKISLWNRIGMALKSITHPEQLFQMLRIGGSSTSGAVVNTKTAMSVSAVFACVRVISETLGMLPCVVYKKQGKSNLEAPTHPVWQVLRKKPNPWQTPMEFIEMLTAHAVLRGNGYAYINWVKDPRSGFNTPYELIPIHPDRVQVCVEDDYSIVYKIYSDSYRSSSKAVAIDVIKREDMLHIRGLSLNGYEGVSVLQYQRDMIGFGITLQEHGSAMFSNGARIAGVLEHPNKLGEGIAERIRNQWHEVFGGAAQAGRTAVLEEGMKFKEVMMTAEDAQFLESRKYNRSEIASIFRVPAHKIGDLEKATFSNIEQQSLEFISDCMLPWATRWEQAISRDLIEANDFYFARFDFDAIARGDMQTRYRSYAIGRQWGWLSVDDIRNEEGMNPIGKENGGETYLEPLNMKPLGDPFEETPVADKPVEEKPKSLIR